MPRGRKFGRWRVIVPFVIWLKPYNVHDFRFRCSSRRTHSVRDDFVVKVPEAAQHFVRSEVPLQKFIAETAAANWSPHPNPIAGSVGHIPSAKVVTMGVDTLLILNTDPGELSSFFRCLGDHSRILVGGLTGYVRKHRIQHRGYWPAVYKVKGRKSRCLLDGRIICERHEWEHFIPCSVLYVDIHGDHIGDSFVKALGEPICLWMIGCCLTVGGVTESQNVLRKLRPESRSAVCN